MLKINDQNSFTTWVICQTHAMIKLYSRRGATDYIDCLNERHSFTDLLSVNTHAHLNPGIIIDVLHLKFGGVSFLLPNNAICNRWAKE